MTLKGGNGWYSAYFNPLLHQEILKRTQPGTLGEMRQC